MSGSFHPIIFSNGKVCKLCYYNNNLHLFSTVFPEVSVIKSCYVIHKQTGIHCFACYLFTKVSGLVFAMKVN